MKAAIELGGTKALCAVGEGHDRIHDECRIATVDPEATVAAIASFFAPHRKVITALGVASFGPLELDESASNAGALLGSPKPGWSDFPLRAALHEALQVPVVIETDVNAAAIAEQRWGNARGADPCVYVTIGTGIGVGVVIAGKPLHGLVHPELGHLPVDPDPTFAGVCPFHQNRCIEGVASAPALRARLGTAAESVDDEHPVWNVESRALARLVATCVLAYSPRRVLLGGGVLMRRGLLERVRHDVIATLQGYVLRAELSPQDIASYVVAPHFGERAGLMGAFALLD